MITIERARQILASYGGSPAQWPEAERAAMQQLLLADSELQELQRQAERMDVQLAGLFAVPGEEDCRSLSRNILARVPDRRPREQERTPRTAYKLEAFWRSLLLRPAATWTLAGGTLILVVALGTLHWQWQLVGSEMQPTGREDAWGLMADALDNSSDLELLAVLEPELSEDDLDIL